MGGTEIVNRGEIPVCDKESGQCQCLPGLLGRQCNEVQDNYYVPTMHQFQYEIEDGYREDQSPVRIGYDDARFPGTVDLKIMHINTLILNKLILFRI